MPMSPEGDLIITVLPFAILVGSTRATSLVLASSWSLCNNGNFILSNF